MIKILFSKNIQKIVIKKEYFMNEIILRKKKITHIN